MADPALFPLRVQTATPAAEGIQMFELMADDGAVLPAYSPGSHIYVKTPNGLLRRYSLTNGPDDASVYQFAVKREANGTGGSRSMVDDTRVGDIIHVSEPRNDFPLITSAPSLVLIAGGIGITPILSMARHLTATGGPPFRLFYLARSPEVMAFREELLCPAFRGRVVMHCDQGNPSQAFDLWPVLEKPKGAHVYCCGPRGLMEAVRDMTGHWPSSAVHFEDFGTTQVSTSEDRAFTLKLARTGSTLTVPAGISILDTLRANGVDVASSCESGSCGTCEVKLLGGEADHRDLVLSEHEKSSLIMVCVSRAKSAELVLDL
jgi:phthalate 4,5-dioxygenase reductase subunit